MNSDEIHKHLMDLTSKSMRRIEDECIKDSDRSRCNRAVAQYLLASIRRCERRLEILLEQTQEIGGFCSSYPTKALESIRLMKEMVEMEANTIEDTN